MILNFSFGLDFNLEWFENRICTTWNRIQTTLHAWFVIVDANSKDRMCGLKLRIVPNTASLCYTLSPTALLDRWKGA